MTLAIQLSPDILRLIFFAEPPSYATQASVSCVCKLWRQVIQDTSQEPVRCFNMLRGAIFARPVRINVLRPDDQTLLAETAHLREQDPLSGHIDTLQNRRTGRHLEKSSLHHVFLTKSLQNTLLDVVYKVSGNVVQIDIDQALDDVEKENLFYRKQGLCTVVGVSQNSFTTISDRGIAAAWTIAENVATCLSHRQILTNVQESVVAEDLNIMPDIHQVRDRGRRWYIQGHAWHAIGMQQLIALQDRHFNQGQIVEWSPLDCVLDSHNSRSHQLFELRDLHFNADTIFEVQAIANQSLEALRLNDDHEVSQAWNIALPDSEVPMYITASVNDQWVVLLRLHPPTPNTTTFHVFDARTGVKHCEFRETFDRLGVFDGNIIERLALEQPVKAGICWLHNNFLAVFVGKKLHLWHLPSKLRVTKVDLEPFLVPHELGATHNSLNYQPLLNVEVYGSELHLFLNPYEGDHYKFVRLTLQPLTRQNRVS